MIIRDNEIADLETPTGTMRAHIFRPVAPGKYPGILMFSEIFQVTEIGRASCRERVSSPV